jgi:hypothetical protein
MALEHATLNLEAAGWTQTLAGRRPPGMVLEAVRSADSEVLRVPGLGNIMELLFTLEVARGDPDWQLAGMDENAVGFLAHYDSGESGGATIGGGFALPEEAYDDLWLRVRSGVSFSASVFVTATPIHNDGLGNLTWDRADRKFLSITDVQIKCRRTLEETSAGFARRTDGRP